MVVLIGFDDSMFGLDALALGLNIARRRHDTATVVAVWPDDDRGISVAAHDTEWIRRETEAAEKKLTAARGAVGDGNDVKFEAAGPGSAARILHEYAERMRPAVLVLGSSEHAAVGRVSFGSTVERLMAGAPCPVAVAPRGYRESQGPIRSLAVAYDDSSEAKHALEIAAGIAKRDGLLLRLITVVGEPDPNWQRHLEDTLKTLGDDVQASAELFVASNVADTLADLPGEHPDLLVCGSRGYGAIRQVLLGSVSARVVRHASYPVIVVPRPADPSGN